MKLPHLLSFVLGAIGLAGMILAVVETNSARKTKDAIATANRRDESARQKIASLESELQAHTRQAEAIEGDNRLLAVAMERARQTQGAKPKRETTSVSSAEVEERIKRAIAQVENGDPEATLRELLWCYDNGVQFLSSSARRAQPRPIANALSRLGERFPPAQLALRERMEKAQARLLSAVDDSESVVELANLSRALKDKNAITSVYDQIPPGDPRRKSLAIYGFDQFVDSRRYGDALFARDYAMMSSVFELNIQDRTPPSNVRDPDRMKRLQRDYAVNMAAVNIEVLAGTGDVEHARVLAERLLKYDPSEDTRALVQKHMERAGRPDLLATWRQP